MGGETQGLLAPPKPGAAGVLRATELTDGETEAQKGAQNVTVMRCPPGCQQECKYPLSHQGGFWGPLALPYLPSQGHMPPPVCSP